MCGCDRLVLLKSDWLSGITAQCCLPGSCMRLPLLHAPASVACARLHCMHPPPLHAPASIACTRLRCMHLPPSHAPASVACASPFLPSAPRWVGCCGGPPRSPEAARNCYRNLRGIAQPPSRATAMPPSPSRATAMLKRSLEMSCCRQLRARSAAPACDSSCDPSIRGAAGPLCQHRTHITGWVPLCNQGMATLWPHHGPMIP